MLRKHHLESLHNSTRQLFLHPIPGQTGVNSWQLQYPSAYPPGSPAVLGPHETVQSVAQRGREALNDQRATARRVLLHQQE